MYEKVILKLLITIDKDIPAIARVIELLYSNGYSFEKVTAMINKAAALKR